MRPERIDLQSLVTPVVNDASLKGIANRITKGSVFAYPTETIYGIGALCTIPGTKEKIFAAKKRAPENPLILIAASLDHFRGIDLTFPPSAKKLAEAFWPGLLSLVVPSSGDPAGVGIRVSNHPFITALYQYLDAPLYSTSANYSNEPYKNDPDHIFTLFANSIDFFIDAGPLPQSLPSTVVKISENDTVTIIREGAVPGKKIEEVLGRKFSGTPTTQDGKIFQRARLPSERA
jgi:L-threonylcarbamoyladenylate synthase